MVRFTEHESRARESVRRRLPENDLKPWRKDMWCIPKVNAAYVAAMEDVLDHFREAARPPTPFWAQRVSLIDEVHEVLSNSREPV